MSPEVLSIAGFIAIWGAALAIAWYPRTRPYGFAAWVVASVSAALVSPSLFLGWMPLPYGNWLTLLLQIAMFGMGATLTVGDFVRVLKMPWGILIGFLLQFLVMPFLGWGISKALGLPVELLLGMVLLGASPGGISSNVITYMSRGNVALSVTMTACSTLAAPLMTPLMVFLYVRESVDIDYLGMFWNILLTVVAPVVVGVVVNRMLTGFRVDMSRAERGLATVSMIAICLICALIAAKSQALILSVGPLLLVAVTLHNLGGFSLGYLGAYWMGLDARDCRTVAIEVGLQNGGMAANLATEVLKKDAAAIAPALFAPVMNVTGSILASYWSRTPAETSSRS